MVGATDTNSGPEVAPTGIVIPIVVLLHKSIVIGALFNVTKLPPWEAPNPVPSIATWLPTDPVVVETLVMTGAGFAIELTDTLSNAAVVRVDVVSLLTTKPTYTFCAMVIVWLVPTCTQFTPSVDVYPLKRFPLRTSFNHFGAPGHVPSYVPAVLPPVLVR